MLNDSLRAIFDFIAHLFHLHTALGCCPLSSDQGKTTANPSTSRHRCLLKNPPSTPSINISSSLSAQESSIHAIHQVHEKRRIGMQQTLNDRIKQN